LTCFTLGVSVNDFVVSAFDEYLAKSDYDAEDRKFRREQFRRDWAVVNAVDVARNMVVNAVLHPAVAGIDKTFADDPIVESLLRQSAADGLETMGMLEEALMQQERAVALRREAKGDDDPATLVSQNDLGKV
jgi:hypothetical protein